MYLICLKMKVLLSDSVYVRIITSAGEGLEFKNLVRKCLINETGNCKLIRQNSD